MTREQANVMLQLDRIGIDHNDANKLRRIAMTLHRWHALECGVGDKDTIFVERTNEDGTGRPYMVSANTDRRWKTADRETGALKRLAAIMARYATLAYYVQGDPRGAALYILRPGDVPGDGRVDAFYSRGIAVY